MTALTTEVGRAYLAIADLSEATLDPLHAVDIAEWAVEQRHPLRSRWDRLMRGHTRTWWQAQALREHLARAIPPARRAEDDAGHHPNCYQNTGVPDDMPPGICDCRVLRMIDAATSPVPPEPEPDPHTHAWADLGTPGLHGSVCRLCGETQID